MAAHFQFSSYVLRAYSRANTHPADPLAGLNRVCHVYGHILPVVSLVTQAGFGRRELARIFLTYRELSTSSTVTGKTRVSPAPTPPMAMSLFGPIFTMSI